MKPEFMLCGEISEWSQRIQGSSTGGPRGPDHQKRQIPGGAILSQQQVEPIDIESQLVVYANQTGRLRQPDATRRGQARWRERS